MGLWCKDLPFVRVERGTVPKPVTLVMPYYCNPLFFAQQLEHWSRYPAALAAQLSIIVVDDGSPADQAAKVPEPVPANLRLFRIDQDVRWNWLAARNIGAHEAKEGWLLLTDMDHMVPTDTLAALIYGVHRADTIYGFSRAEHTGATIEPHKNSWMITREMFWKVGGYDERISGLYGSDGDWRRRCAATAPMAILTAPLVRHEFLGDSSTTRYLRKQPEDTAVQRIVAARGKDWRPKVLSFPYVDVTPKVPKVPAVPV